MNIDKDIEIVRNFNDGFTFKHCETCFKFNEEDSCCNKEKCEELQAIENVLSEFQGLREFSTETVRNNAELQVELETYKKIVDEKNKELNEENLRCSKLAVENNDLKEKLETWKKIAEKLADKMIYLPINKDGIFYCTKEAVIDWARKEVEKDE